MAAPPWKALPITLHLSAFAQLYFPSFGTSEVFVFEAILDAQPLTLLLLLRSLRYMCMCVKGALVRSLNYVERRRPQSVVLRSGAVLRYLFVVI